MSSKHEIWYLGPHILGMLVVDKKKKRRIVKGPLSDMNQVTKIDRFTSGTVLSSLFSNEG
jgi:hypothetical protein